MDGNGHAVAVGVIHHFIDLCLVDIAGAAAGNEGQTHGAEAESGKLLILELFI